MRLKRTHTTYREENFYIKIKKLFTLTAVFYLEGKSSKFMVRGFVKVTRLSRREG